MTLGAISKLLDSKSAVVSLSIIAAASALCYYGKLPVGDWKEVALALGVTYVGGEKVRDTAAAWRDGSKPVPAKKKPAQPVEPEAE